MTEQHVEARSLAELNYLAAHPPQYPTNPAEKKQDPLVLYISRVPGTRDIILSPFKPQVKNVTAEDVASSLYYVHLDAPEDELLVPPEQARDSSSPRSSSESRRTKIQRKPLPATANLTDIKDSRIDPATRILHPALRPGNQNYDSHSHVQQPAPNAQLDSAFMPPPQKAAGPPTGSVQRKPFGPRAIVTGNRDNVDRNPPPPAAYPDEPPPLPPRQQQHQENIPPSANHHSHSHSNSNSHTHAQQLAPSPVPGSRPIRSPSPNKKRPFRPFSLTLIRRDRSSDEQWNVGKVSAFQCPDPLSIDYYNQHHSSSSSNNSRHSQTHSPVVAPSILIHLESSGYSKFRGMPTRISVGSGGEIRPSFDMRRPHSSGAASTSRFGGSGGDEYLQPSFAPAFAPAPAQGGLEREVKMAYSPSLATNIRQAFKGGRRRRSSAAGADGFSPTSPSKSPSGGGGGHGRHGSSAASVRSLGGGDFDLGSGGGTEPPSSSSIITRPGPGLKARGYVFESPWGGRCEFVTGNAGRTLRCRHILPNYSGNVFNPLVADGGGADGESGTGGGGRSRGLSSGAIGGGPHSNGGGSHKKALPVSELRFNLPSSEVLFSKDTSGSPRTRDQIHGQFSRFLNNAAAARQQQQQRSSNRSRSRSGGGGGGGGGSGNNNHYYSSEGDEDFDFYDDPDQRIDMSLGREKAGGGNRGSRAKMGKLIIAPDGLKMLDLVVAANVGVWWTSWERTFGDETW